MARIVIVGAGLAGLSAAYHARLRGFDYELYEAEANVGGTCKTIEKDGFFFDYSGHLLHLKQAYFQGLVKELLGDNLNVHKKKSFIYSNGVYTRYPFQANLYGLPPEIIKECLLGFVKAYYENKDLPTSSYETFHDWIIAKLGSGIGNHFMFPYNEKLWTLSTKELTCEWLSEYVPKPSLEDVFDGSFGTHGKDLGYNVTFWYPKSGGIQALCDAFASRLPGIRLKEKVSAIDLTTRTVHFTSGMKTHYEKLISTMPLKVLVKKLGGQLPIEAQGASLKLRHNSVLIVNIGLRGAGLTDKHWIYLPEKRFTAYRIGVYTNFSKLLAPKNTTSYYIEIGYQKEWGVNKEALVARAVEEIVGIGLIKKLSDILVKEVVDLEYAYVVYDRNYSSARKIIMDSLLQHGIISIGRYGNWEYTGMEEAMSHGKNAVDGL